MKRGQNRWFLNLLRVLICLLASTSTIESQENLQCDKALATNEIVDLLEAGVPEIRLKFIVTACGVNFELTDQLEKRFRSLGASDTTILAMVRAKRFPAKLSPDPSGVLSAQPTDPVEQFRLGEKHFKGEGLPQNYAEALKWYRKAAQQGHVVAKHRLGTLYRDGQGVSQDAVQAYAWYSLSAAGGNTAAVEERDKLAKNMTSTQIGRSQYLVGKMYQKAEVVAKDYVHAYFWYSLSAASGYAAAAEDRVKLAAKITGGQLLEAQRLIQEWEEESKALCGNGETEVSFIGHSKRVWSVAFSPDGRLLASGSDDGTVKLWEVANRREITLRGGNKIHSVSFSPDGSLLASGSADGIVRLWDVATGQEVRKLKGHTGQVWGVEFSPDGSLLGSASDDGTVRLWELAKGQELRTFRGTGNQLRSLAFSPDGHWLASGGFDKDVFLWEVSTGREVVLRGHKNFVNAVAFSPDGRLLASGGYDGTVKIWKVATGQEVRSLKNRGNIVWSVTFSPDGRLLATGNHDRTVRLWETETGREVRTFRGHSKHVTSVAFSPEGCWVASASNDKVVRLWQLVEE